jgi:hypothetical protein
MTPIGEDHPLMKLVREAGDFGRMTPAPDTHDATIDPIDVQLLGRCEDEVCRQGDARHALRRERDWYRDAWLREQAEAEKWHARHGSVCWFSIFAVSAVVWLLASHLWDAAVWIWRWL